MPKSIFEVDVDDEGFKKFKKLVDSYQAALAKMPKQWAKVNDELDGAAERIDDVAAKGRKAAGSVRDMGGAVDGLNQRLSRASHTMGSLVMQARSLLNTTGLLTLGAGLLGGGALWGAASLAGSAGHYRRSAQGFGVGIGDMLAFKTNFAKFADPSAVLGNIAGAKNDPSQWWALESMGLRDWRNRDAASLGPEAAITAKRIFAEGGGNAAYAQARGLTQIFSMEDLRRLEQMTEAEIRAATASYEADQKQMKVADQTAASWQKLSIQLDRAATTIETGFIRNLSPLAPQIEKLSAAFVKVTGDLFSTERLGEVIQVVSKGIEDAAKYIGSDQFKKDLQDFGEGVGEIAKALLRAARWINGTFRRPEDQSLGGAYRGGRQSLGGLGTAEWHAEWASRGIQAGLPPGFGTHWMGGGAQRGQLGTDIGVDTRGGLDPAGWLFGDGRGNPVVRAAEQRHNLPPGTLDRIWAAESGRGRTMGPSRAGALGHFQFMPATGAQYGLSGGDFNDLGRSAGAAGHYMSDLMRMFGGDMTAAVAAYNYGPGNVRRLMRERGSEWQQALPAETQGYLRSVLADRFGRGVTVRVENNTGGSAIVTSNVTVAQ